MNKIKRAAKVFLQDELKGKIGYIDIKGYLQRIGYQIILYNIEDDFTLLNKYGINTNELNVNAFTLCTDNFKAVFIDDRVTSDNVIYSLLHEIGHIVLRHLENESICTNSRLQDMQADVFAYEVLNYKTNKHIYINFFIILLLTLVLGITIYSKNQNVQQKEQIEMVYITSSGVRYHCENCIYIKGKNCSALTVEQAKKNYTPCKVCNP